MSACIYVYTYCGVNCIGLCIACIYVHICYGVDCIGLCIACIYVHICYGVDCIGLCIACIYVHICYGVDCIGLCIACIYVHICYGVDCIGLCIACIYVHICYGVDCIGYQWPYGTSGLEASHFCPHRDAANGIRQCSVFFHTARIPVSHTYIMYVALLYTYIGVTLLLRATHSDSIQT